ncbi:AAA family ATPase [Candidatus Jorgensenbacteria bacterium RIFCSPLOWO2_01_FULL_45_25b]|uniref:AAA family ATPase n=2 Tax=Parcubacteria group TaxID=1794811 RepID=A0A1F6BU75_9BACT|nr:MAG: AAA family ATPase [Candidatus Azambacteria bacterium RIFCSPHIGHO2_01_FULL_40_24]OGG40460.1 MAG: AAA family ATPase [Candidatus Jorgensenbacteria bacterium RIFCSPLOWO2_01_FULL_45_25b]
MEPLASKIRPKNLDDIVGQTHLIRKGAKSNPPGPLRVAIEKKHLFSFLLWGPPGVGKTTLARIYAKALNADYHELSAVSAGKEDIRNIIQSDGGLLGPRVLFLDEIHRFNKAQQDYLLPFVESGNLTLIGATTENPSFEIIPALLSRCRVFVMEELSENDMKKIIKRAGYEIGKDAIDWLIAMSCGDARIAIATIENTAELYKQITLENLKNSFQSKFLRYDKKGEEHFNTISAFIKSMRASQPDAAVYYLARMIEAGEDPKFIARRMVIFASEDIGNALPTALVVANAVFEAVEKIGLPECGINLAHGVIYLSQAPKNRAVYDAYKSAIEDAKTYGNLPIPLIIRNAPTKLMKNLGYGKNYEKYTKENLLPEKLRNKTYLWVNPKKPPQK